MDLTVDEAHLGQFAENTACRQTDEGRRSTRPTARHVRNRLKLIRDCFRRGTEFYGREKRIPGELEWLLDNWYIAEREGREALAALKGCGRLPFTGGEERVPAVLDLANALVRSGQNEVTPERIALFLDAAQTVRALDERELSLFVPMLKIALVGAVASLCGELDRVMRGTRRGGEENIFRAEAAAARAREAGETPEGRLLELARQAREEHVLLGRLMGNAFTSLRMLSSANLTETLEGASRVEKLLCGDPAGVYPRMDEKSRGWYRSEISRLARRERLTEYETARRVVELAKQGKDRERHVGYYIFRCPLGKPGRKRRGFLYVGGIVLATLFFALFFGYLLQNLWVALLLLGPISDIAKNVADFSAVRLTRPRPVARLALEEGVPAEGRTLCVISALLTDGESGTRYAGLLEQYRLANRDAGENLIFGLLADLPDSPETPGEEQRRWIARAGEEIARLNAKSGGGYFLFFRDPVWNERDRRYMGWERKRGAIVELTRLLRDKKTGLRTEAGDPQRLRGVRYLITLDSDTRLGVGTAREMIGAMLHPLNRPVLDPERGVVTEGYGLLQPRISVELEAANRSRFSRVFAGQGGIDPYGSTTSDVYHDLFDEATFTGKGILDVNAFSLCLDSRFPENRVLSHDLLEGAYLRAGLIGDVELTDSYPYKVTSYFARLHRWIRGDWQAAPWILDEVPSSEGEERNPLSSITRWKLFDNLRRSVSPILTFAALLLGMLFSGPIFAVSAGIAVLCAASNLLLSGAELAFRRGAGLRTRYHSTIVAGFGGVVLQTLIQLLLLPYQAWICASAIGTALYRMLISKRNLLAWVTADAAEQGAKGSPAAFFRAMAPALILGLFALLFSAIPAGSAAGFAWAVSPAVSWAISRKERPRRRMKEADRAFLLHEAALIWRYFSDFMTEDNHWLPPDNYQEQPAAGLARRTSPTNMGLGLLCALAASDLQLCPRDRALTLIDRSLATMEKLPRWNGHLYNWYDTGTLRTLHPRCVSTVDSGNLCGCLIALREGLLEQGGEREQALAARADALAAGMRFAALYDRSRKLFYIGYDAERGKAMDGWYDLMASEARQTSYIAVARGEVEPRHWRRLGRALTEENDYRGMASWTGTMFEYLMPHLLMPCYPNSLLYESARFCVYVQKRRTAGKRIPWGVSESAFYAFDGALNYQYKAHGVQKLAFKRGMNRELVVSPYSSFLALGVTPSGAVRNLRALRELGMEGKYGLYEAADFTPARQVDMSRYEIVRCFMVHHLGMSLLAADNALRENVMQERFMRDRSMAAFAGLLQEKVPVGAVTVRSAVREVPERVRRTPGAGWERSAKGYDPWNPRCVLLSNGSYRVFATDTGLSESLCGGLALTRFLPRQTGETPGMQFYFRAGGGAAPLLPAPWFDPAVEYSSEMDSASLRIRAKGPGFSSVMELYVPDNENCELREVRLTNEGEAALEGELICYFEPVLAPGRDYEAHPAFSRLALSTALTEGGVMVHRRRRDDQEEKTLVFLCDAEDARFETSREAALGRNGSGSLPFLPETEGKAGAVLDPCVLVRVPVKLKPGEKTQIRFALSAAAAAEDAENAARFVLRLPRSKSPGRLDGALRMLKMTAGEATAAFELLSRITFITRSRAELASWLTEDGQGQRGLWQFGISGDLPILAARVDNAEQCDRAAALVRKFRFLTALGAGADLVLLLADGGDYRRPLRSALLESFKATGCERLLGSKGGIHLIDSAGPETERIIIGNSAALVPLDRNEETPNRDAGPAASHRPDKIRRSGIVPWRRLEDGSVLLDAGEALPPLAWTHVLANEKLGCIAAETGPGHLWSRNAREFKLTPWNNDPLNPESGEKIVLRMGEGEISPFAEGDGTPCAVTYGFGFARWEKMMGGLRLTTTLFVPPDVPARVCVIETEGAAEGKLSWWNELLLGPDRQMQPHVETAAENGAVTARNRYHTGFAGLTALFCASAEPEGFTCDGESWSRGELDGGTGAGRNPCVGMELPFSGGLVLVAGCGESGEELARIRALAEPAAAKAALERTARWWSEKLGRLTVRTPLPALDGYLNGWALYQTIACRMLGRASVYQCGGAYGFRDQLQDACGALYAAPELAREQLLRAAAHQYQEGDAQHWWHPTERGDGPEADRGVRTRISDDLLWLPYAVCEYTEKTGDSAVLAETVPFLISPPLREEERDRYEAPERTAEGFSLLEHCFRAVDRALDRGTGSHGLALMGAGDWNDGFDRVGSEGRGESVWLTWFLAHVLERFSRLCRREGQKERAERYTAEAEKLIAAGGAAWDGEWYLRGYYDDGETLGSGRDEECRIDSIAQSFAALAEGADPARTKQALERALRLLTDQEHRLVKLFTPPFDRGGKDPGYIRSYLPGIRENGGQYTHGAVWLAMGCFLSGMPEEGSEILSLLLPETHDPAVYRAEPYVIAADVYSNPEHAGRGGWSWYTGAAAWYWRVSVEYLLGLKLRDGALTVEPQLPKSWEGFDSVWRAGEAEFHVKVERGEEPRMLVDGIPETELRPEAHPGRHEVRVFFRDEGQL